MRKFDNFWKKSFGFGKKSFCSDTDSEIGPWFWFPIPKPGFGSTLLKPNLKTHRTSEYLVFICMDFLRNPWYMLSETNSGIWVYLLTII